MTGMILETGCPMLDLPRTTAVDRRVPKQTLYRHLTLNPAQRRLFTDQIGVVWWRNKIAPATANLAPGRTVTELEVFELELPAPALDEAALRLIDKAIPYPILYLLRSGGQAQACIGCRPAGGAAQAVYYRTPWMPAGALTLTMQGLDTDAVYENFVRQVAGGVLDAPQPEPLTQTVARDQKRRKLQKQIAALERKIQNEKQFNRQVELNGELKRLRKEMEKL